MVRAGEGGNQRHIGCFCCFECHAALAIGWRQYATSRKDFGARGDSAAVTELRLGVSDSSQCRRRDGGWW
jgi:hypothetical protein